MQFKRQDDNGGTAIRYFFRFDSPPIVTQYLTPDSACSHIQENQDNGLKALLWPLKAKHTSIFAKFSGGIDGCK